MPKINVGLIGYGNVGQGVARLLKQRRDYYKSISQIDFVVKAIADRSIHKKDVRGFSQALLTKDYKKVIANKDVDVVIELVGGIHPAKEIVMGALKNGKDVVTANKELIALHGSGFPARLVISAGSVR